MSSMTYLKCSQDDSSGVTAWRAVGKSEINTAYTTDSTPLCVQAPTCKKTELVALLTAEGMVAKSTITNDAEQNEGKYYHIVCDDEKSASGFSGSAIRCFGNGKWQMTSSRYQEQISQTGAMCSAALQSCEYTPSGGRKIMIDHGRTVKLGDNCNTCTCNDGTATCTKKTCQSCTKAALAAVMTNKKLMYYSAIYEKYVLDNNSPGRTFLLKCKDGFNHQAATNQGANNQGATTDTGKRRLGVAWSTSNYAASRFYVRCSADGSWAETVSNCIGKQKSCTGSDGKVVAHGEKLYKDCHSWCVLCILFPSSLLFPLFLPFLPSSTHTPALLYNILLILLLLLHSLTIIAACATTALASCPRLHV